MQIGSVTSWIAVIALAVFILVPALWFFVFKKGEE